MKTFRILRDARDVATCPTCNEVLPYHSTLAGTGHMPAPNDLSVCSECGEILRFKKDLSVEKLPDLAELHPDDADLMLQLQKEIRTARG